MKMQITRISPRQSSNVVSLFYVVSAFPLAVIGLLMLLFSDSSDNTGIAFFLLLSPIVYGSAAYLMCAIVFCLYNLVAQRTGGIEFSLANVND